MIIIVVVVVLGFGVLLYLAKKEKIPDGTSALLMPFYKIAVFLYKKARPYLARSTLSRRVAENLNRLNPGESGEVLRAEYYAQKIVLCLLVIVVGTMFGVCASVSGKNSVILGQDGLLFREEYPKGPRKIQVSAEYDGMKVTLPIELKPRELTAPEARKMLTRLEEQLPQFILGENKDLQNVLNKLVLSEGYEGFPALVEWKSSRPDVLDSAGTVKNPEVATEVLLTAKMYCGETVRECNLIVVVCPPLLTAEEKLYKELEGILHAGDTDTVTQTEWQLPVRWKGKNIYWNQVITDHGPLIWLGALGVSVLIFFFSDRDLEDKLQKRRQSMRCVYPEIVHKLVLFAEAGMTLRGSLPKIARDYEKRRQRYQSNGSKRTLGVVPAYEEIVFACNELNSGISEGMVYERLGKRIALQEYIRLGMLMAQNLRRGNAVLLERLREEADKAAEEQLRYARKSGEEAGTKLLVPMVLQLAVVMVVIMVPVFLDM